MIERSNIRKEEFIVKKYFFNRRKLNQILLFAFDFVIYVERNHFSFILSLNLTSNNQNTQNKRTKNRQILF